MGLFTNSILRHKFTDKITNVGNYVIVANTPGNNNYSKNSTSSTLQIFAKGQNGPPNLVVPDLQLTYGDTEQIMATSIPSSDPVEIRAAGKRRLVLIRVRLFGHLILQHLK